MSVVIPVYNRANVIGRAIDSVLSQVLPDPTWSIDLIVVDDGSTDKLRDALLRFGDRVICSRHSENRGAASARNTGIEIANGDYIAFLDSDDTWLPGKVTSQLAYMRLNSVPASCTAFILAKPGRADIISPRNMTGGLALSDLVWGSFISPGSTLICDRSIYSDVGLLDTSLMRLEDWDWLIRYGQKYEMGFLAEPLARVEASDHRNATNVFAALDRLAIKFATELPVDLISKFNAALEMERAAAFYRQGSVPRASLSLLRSIAAAPFGHQALAAVLHNRFARH